MNLYRVDIDLKYLAYQEQPPNDDEVLQWLRECHEGELDDSFDVELITDSKQVEDFEDSYCPYSDTNNEEALIDLIPKLGLDIPQTIARLKKAGYTVTKNKK